MQFSLYNVKKLQRKCCNRTPDLVYLVKFCRTIKRRECPQISYADEKKIVTGAIQQLRGQEEGKGFKS